MIHYSLNDDWLEYIDEGYLNEITNIYKVLENDELIEIRLSYTTMYNLRYRDELQFEKGYIEISHFMSIFSEFYIALIDSNIFLYKSDMRQGFIKYSIGNKRNDGYVFVLDIASPTNF
jgi:type II restriction/modification system DNA methylase subunit YeeA